MCANVFLLFLKKRTYNQIWSNTVWLNTYNDILYIIMYVYIIYNIHVCFPRFSLIINWSRMSQPVYTYTFAYLPPMCFLAYLPTYLPIDIYLLYICPFKFIYVGTYISTNLIYPSVHPSNHPSTHYLSINLSIYQSSRLSIYPSIHLSIYPSIHLSIYPSIKLSSYLAI